MELDAETMKKFLLLTLVLVIGVEAEARTIEEHILVSYDRVLAHLKQRGFEGPFGEELAKLAMIRRIHEDGPNREHTKSIVGMIPGGINRKVMKDLGLRIGKESSQGLTLKQLTANDGQQTYGIYGPGASVVSTVAIVMVWDRYVNELGCFDESEIRAWNKSKVISRSLANGTATPKAKVLYRSRLAETRKKILEKANRLYGVNAAKHIAKTAEKMAPIFELVKPRVAKY
jgi:hypothetical protein